jgi:hypothetical protein
MGSNQFLLLALCFIVVGASIRVGISQYKASEIGQDKDNLMTCMQTIATDAIVFRTKGKSLGGGKNSYVGFKLTKKKSSDNFGSYKVAVSKNKITVTATSKLGYGTIAKAFDNKGNYVNKSLVLTGSFKK